VPNSIAETCWLKTGSLKQPMVSTAIALAIAGCPVRGSADNARAEDHQDAPPSLSWSFAGPSAKFDRGQLQRGYKIYKEVCFDLPFDEPDALPQPGRSRRSGILAGAGRRRRRRLQVQTVPTTPATCSIARAGLPTSSPPLCQRAGRPRGQRWALPPDLLADRQGAVLRARLPAVHLRLLQAVPGSRAELRRRAAAGLRRSGAEGFQAPGRVVLQQVFPRHAIKMPKPLSDDQVTYDDGTPQKLDQYAKDVGAFLMWTAEPHLVERKRLGGQVMIFLLIFAGLMYLHQEEGLGQRALSGAWMKVQKSPRFAGLFYGRRRFVKHPHRTGDCVLPAGPQNAPPDD